MLGPADTQRAHVGLYGKACPHLLIHGGSDVDRCRGGQNHRRKEVVGKAVGETRDGVGARRRDENSLSPAGEFDVSHGGLALLVPETHADRLPGKRLEGGGRDEVGRAFGHHHAHLGLEVAQAADELADLVGGDTSGNANEDATLAKTHGETGALREGR